MGGMAKVMVNIRIERETIEIFDKVAKKHSRDRTKEIKKLILDDIRTEFPDYQPSEESTD